MENKTNCNVPNLAMLLLAGAGPLAAQAEQTPRSGDDITIEIIAPPGPTVFEVDLEQAPPTSADSAGLLRRAPGANVNRNGPLTGLAQYRGMYTDRVNVQVNGIHISTGGPNGMDPALSYIPRNLLGSIEVIRGIAPVSSGTESIGGTIIANTKTSEFGTSKELTPGLDFATGGGTADSSYSVSTLGSLANRNHRLHAYGSRENGGNIEIPDGKIRPSRHERNNYGAGYGFRHLGQEVSLDLRRNRTDNTGTPSLPMDIDYIDSDFYESEYSGTVGSQDLHGQLYYTDVEHEMSNYELRDAPVMMGNPMTRRNHTKSDAIGYRADVSRRLGNGVLMIGSDGHFADHDAKVTDPVNNPNVAIDAYNDIERDAFGLFAEWNGSIASDMNAQLGLRYSRVKGDAGEVSHFMSMMNPGIATLQNRFNDSDRNNQQNNIDLVVKLDYALSPSLKAIAEGGMKNRAPSYQELYLWVPLQSTNGLADGHNYVGDVDLHSERAYEAGLGLDWHTDRAWVAPRVFYRHVDDYIQGTPSSDPVVIAVSTMGGDPNPLQWSNVDARFYGADMDWGFVISDNWSLDGVASYVRGERDDIDDDLYRIAPLNGSATLTYRRGNWWTAAEGVAYAKQDKISETNDEEKSKSYQLLNLRGGVTLMKRLKITAGVDNVLDKEYQDHLAGINRVADSDVELGERVPGPGRNYFASLQYSY